MNDHCSSDYDLRSLHDHYQWWAIIDGSALTSSWSLPRSKGLIIQDRAKYFSTKCTIITFWDTRHLMSLRGFDFDAIFIKAKRISWLSGWLLFLFHRCIFVYTRIFNNKSHFSLVSSISHIIWRYWRPNFMIWLGCKPFREKILSFFGRI